MYQVACGAQEILLSLGDGLGIISCPPASGSHPFSRFDSGYVLLKVFGGLGKWPHMSTCRWTADPEVDSRRGGAKEEGPGQTAGSDAGTLLAAPLAPAREQTQGTLEAEPEHVHCLVLFV